jgi:hypothetical protein
VVTMNVADKIELPPLVRAYWFTDVGQRVGLYAEPGLYRYTGGIRNIEGIEAVNLSREDVVGVSYWFPWAVVQKLLAQGVAS